MSCTQQLQIRTIVFGLVLLGVLSCQSASALSPWLLAAKLANGLPKPAIQPYVVGLTSYNGDGIYLAGKPLYFFLSFSEPIRVVTSGGSPQLRLATGSHFESGANNAVATFLAGGITTSRNFWKVDRPSNYTEAALPCKAGAVNDPTKGGDAYCLSSVPELRDDGLMDNVLAFTFTVSAGQLSGDLDYTDPGALLLNGATITSAANAAMAALLQLPQPGTLNSGKPGTPQSLSWNKNLQIGTAYVTNVTSSTPPGAYGLKPGGVADVIYVNVSFSAPVTVACAFQGDTCFQIQLALDTGPVTHDTTTGVAGWVVFPTAYLIKVTTLPPNVISFRYIVRRGDVTTALKALPNGLLITSPASIQRTQDRTPVGIALPPASSPYSLQQTTSLSINAVF